MRSFFSPSFLRYVLPAVLVVLLVVIWLSGMLAHPGTDGGWIYHYQSLVAGFIALIGGFFVIVSTHMSLVAADKEQRSKANIYWDRYKLELEIFAAFVTNDVLVNKKPVFNVLVDRFPRTLFDVANLQYLAADKRTFVNVVYAEFWKIETLLAKGDVKAAVDELAKLMGFMSRHLKVDEVALDAVNRLRDSVE